MRTTETGRLRLYYSPGACSLAPHAALEEAGADFEPVRLDFSTAEQRGAAYLAINQKGRVPALQQGDWVLTENPAILRFIARAYPAAGLWPDEPRAEAACMEWLAWSASTIHPAYAHVRRAERYATSEAAKAEVVERGRESCGDLWTMIEVNLSRGPFAAGNALSVADLYLFVFWLWGRGPMLGYDMPRAFPHWTDLMRGVAARPAIARVLEREGLTPP